MKQYYVPLTETIHYPFYPVVPEISLELTSTCNLKCPYCANGSLTRQKVDINWNLLEKIVAECANLKYDLAWLHGVGEPLLCNRLEEAVTLIKTKGAGRGSFATNGTLLSEKRVKSLLDAGLDSIYVSIDTLDPEIYKNTRGGKLSIVVENVKQMILTVPKSFKIKIALMNHKDHRITQETIELFHKTFGYHENVTSNLVQNSLFPSAPGDYRVETGKSPACFAPVNYLFIAADGQAAMCCLDQDVRHSLGNVTERSIQDIWYDRKNQTTFRNVAAGIFSCPAVCVEKCILAEPNKAPGNMILLGFGLPFDQALQFAEIMVINNQATDALPIVQSLIKRSPQHQRAREMMQFLTQQQPRISSLKAS